MLDLDAGSAVSEHRLHQRICLVNCRLCAQGFDRQVDSIWSEWIGIGISMTRSIRQTWIRRPFYLKSTSMSRIKWNFRFPDRIILRNLSLWRRSSGNEHGSNVAYSSVWFLSQSFSSLMFSSHADDPTRRNPSVWHRSVFNYLTRSARPWIKRLIHAMISTSSLAVDGYRRIPFHKVTPRGRWWKFLADRIWSFSKTSSNKNRN